jgi:hypothetical protein
VSDVWSAYGRKRPNGIFETHPAAFTDLEKLTMFADYRVPQLLRSLGILQYTVALAGKIDAKQELGAGSEEEVEIRAATVHAVERLRRRLELKQAKQARTSSSTTTTTSTTITTSTVLTIEVDWLLWERGERMKDGLPPHHRTLTMYY